MRVADRRRVEFPERREHGIGQRRLRTGSRSFLLMVPTIDSSTLPAPQQQRQGAHLSRRAKAHIDADQRLRYAVRQPTVFARNTMATPSTNKKKVLVTETFSASGMAMLKERSDVETLTFANAISSADFNALLKQHAPVHAVALGGTPFGENELEFVRRHARRHPHRRRLRRGRYSLAEQAQGSADDHRHRQLAVGGGGGAVHDAGAGQARRRARCAGEGEPLGRPHKDNSVRRARQNRDRGRLRPHRHAHREALPGDGNERAGLRSVQAGG